MILISSSDFTSRTSLTKSLQSIKEPLILEFKVSKSFNGIRNEASSPFKSPILFEPFSTLTNSDTPSSSRRGDGHVIISSTQVRSIKSLPISGITAIGFPLLGIITNQGRVGLCQKRLLKPV